MRIKKVKRDFLVVIFMVFLVACNVGKNVNQDQELEYGNSCTVKVDWSTKTFLKTYKDSVQNLRNRENIPDFLSNDCFDYEHKFYWENKHKPQSFRKEIILSISNIKVVQLLLKNKDLISNKECDLRVEAPYGGQGEQMVSQELTNMDLLKLRLSELSK